MCSESKIALIKDMRLITLLLLLLHSESNYSLDEITVAVWTYWHWPTIRLFRLREHPVQLDNLPSCVNDEQHTHWNSRFWRNRFHSRLTQDSRGHWSTDRSLKMAGPVLFWSYSVTEYSFPLSLIQHDKQTLCSVHCLQR